MLAVVGRNYRLGGHREASRRAFQRAIAIRTEVVKQDSSRRFSLAQLYFETEQWQVAYDIIRKLKTMGPGQRIIFAIAAAHVGDTATALAVLGGLEGSDRRTEADLDRALIQIALGRREDALSSLRAAIDAGVVPSFTGWYVRPELNPLRRDPRFEALIRPQ